LLSNSRNKVNSSFDESNDKIDKSLFLIEIEDNQIDDMFKKENNEGFILE
jgi:hypothetical protein